MICCFDGWLPLGSSCRLLPPADHVAFASHQYWEQSGIPDALANRDGELMLPIFDFSFFVIQFDGLFRAKDRASSAALV